MAVITFLDLVQMEGFRKYVSNRLSNAIGDISYGFPDTLPVLYKYRPLSKYAIDDIINGNITATSIGDFNDLFDGAIHGYGTKRECIDEAEKEWKLMESLLEKTGSSDTLITHEEYVGNYKEYYKTKSRILFRNLDYLGTYVCCFSQKYDSTLMWAHYADSNMGICIEYDFNDAEKKVLQKYMVFPIAYSEGPVNLLDLVKDDKCEIYKYPLDAAVLCAALNKAKIWDYEKEWRLIYVLNGKKEQRIEVKTAVKPKSIILGYHFLKPFFYYDFHNQSEKNLAVEKLKEFMRLIEYVEVANIPIWVMAPSFDKYNLDRKSIHIDKIKVLMKKHFNNTRANNIKYYHVIHDELMDYIEEESEWV